MKRMIIECIMLMAVGFGQTVYKSGEIRLSPRLLNYQGYLTDTLGNPLTNPSVSMTFTIFDAASSGNQKWTETQSSVGVDKGIFHVLLGIVAEIPDSVFNTIDRWLELSVDGQTLTPRTRIVSAPYAYMATYADTALYARTGAADNDWSFRVTDTADTTLQMGGMWGLTRAGNMLYGNADSTHVNLGVASYTGVTGQNYKYCTVGGGRQNRVFGSCATIAGGEYNYIDLAADGAFIGGGYDNTVSDDYSVVSGGYNNTVTGRYSSVCGGDSNTAGSYWTSIAGGNNNVIRSSPPSNYSFIGSGWLNNLSGTYSVIAGGRQNSSMYSYTMIGGGIQNSAIATNATVAGGRSDTAQADYGAILGGYSNMAGDASIFDTAATVCAGYNNTAIGRHTFIGGGKDNIANFSYATVAGGYANLAYGSFTVVSGGSYNNAHGPSSAVGGGYNNYADGMSSCIPGGQYDSSVAFASFATNNNSKVLSTHDNSAAFNGTTTTSSYQMRVGILSKAGGTFTIDHPLDPENKILNHYFVESPEMVLIYRGSADIGADCRATIHLPDYFDALNEEPIIYLTGIGTSDVYVVENVKSNTFVVGGKAGAKVNWMVTGCRKDPSAKITKILVPVEQVKEGGLVGRSLDDEVLVGTKRQLERMGQADGFKFRHVSEQKRYEEMKRMIEESENK